MFHDYERLGPTAGMGWEGTALTAAHFLFWILIAVGVYYFITRHGHRYLGHRREDALEVAKLRYAKGEITKDEYEKLKKDLI